MAFISFPAPRSLFAAVVAAASLLSLTAAHAADRHVRIINGTDHVMVRFYASNTGSDSWEEDILGRDTLDSGDSVNVNIDDGTGRCMFDFKAVFDDGEELIRHDVNVCEISSYRYSQ